jgi:hypothetical protein
MLTEESSILNRKSELTKQGPGGCTLLFRMTATKTVVSGFDLWINAITLFFCALDM